jgi:CheY-like chemotaxis protein
MINPEPESGTKASEISLYSEIEDEDVNFDVRAIEFVNQHASMKLYKNMVATKQKILLVDDQQFNIEAIEILMLYGFKLETKDICDHAFNGKQALESVKKNVEQNGFCEYNLILIDCNMPFMDGYEATTAIREYLFSMGLEQPIITAVTGHVDDNNVNKGIACGMN